MSPALLFGAALLSYLLVVKYLRFRRRNALQLHFPNRQTLSRMTNVEAQKIVNQLTELEFPFVFLTSLQFALFKVRLPVLLESIAKQP